MRKGDASGSSTIPVQAIKHHCLQSSSTRCGNLETQTFGKDPDSQDGVSREGYPTSGLAKPYVLFELFAGRQSMDQTVKFMMVPIDKPGRRSKFRLP